MMGTRTVKDRRSHPRHALPKAASALTDDDVVDGVIRDISVGGIALRTDEALEIGQVINLEIEGMAGVAGRVIRSLDDGFVVALDLDADGNDAFIAEMMRIRDEAGTDDL